MASYVIYPGDGTQTDFAVPFPYLSTDHVKVFTKGVEVAPTWLNSALIRVPAVLADAVLLVQRITPKTPLTIFENTNNLTAENLTLAETQALFIAEEASDRAAQSIIIDDASGQYNFNGRRATNVASPVDAQDAVTRGWAETSMTSTLAQAIQQATNAAASAASADEDAGYAASERLTISGWKDTISGWKDTISGWYTAISGWYTAINGWQAQVSADKATVAADKGTVAADKATVAADKAATSGYKDAASTSATNAHTSEVNAAASAADAATLAASLNPANILTKDGALAGITDLVAARNNIGLGAAATRGITDVTNIRKNNGNGVPSIDQIWAANDYVDLGNKTGAFAIDGSTGVRFKATLTGNVTVSFVNLKGGQPIELVLVQDAAGGRTVSWSGVYWPNGTAPAVTTAASSVAVVFSGAAWTATTIFGLGWKLA